MDKKLSALQKSDILDELETSYNALKEFEASSRGRTNRVSAALRQLLTANFDDEQIWSQIELQNNEALKTLKKSLSKFEASYDDCPALLRSSRNLSQPNGSLISENNIKPDSDDGSSDEKRIEDDDENEELFDEENSSGNFPNHSIASNSFSKKTSELDDNFFRLEEMEAFLEKEEANYGKDADGSDDDTEISFSDEESSGDEDELKKRTGKELYYGDFFDPPHEQPSSSQQFPPGNPRNPDGKRRVSFAPDVKLEDDENENNEEDEEQESIESGDEMLQEMAEGPKSSLEEREHRLKSLISGKEEENLQAKSWQMAGEVVAEKRPENSLLEEHLQYDHGTRPAPVITQDHTERLEELILQRIRDKAWDDVERKVKPVADPAKYRNDIVLDQEKSKLSLGEVYEKEFLKTKEVETEEKEIASHEEIRTMMKSLFRKLDALTNFHYTPNKAAPEIRIINNMRSLDIEEVAPVTTNDETLLAPEEVKKAVTETDLKADAEKTDTDKKRERKKKKNIQRAKAERKKAKDANALMTQTEKGDLAKIGKVQKPVLDPSMEKKRKKGKVGASSADFFNKLQDEVNREVHGTDAKRKKMSSSSSDKNGASWKL